MALLRPGSPGRCRCFDGTDDGGLRHWYPHRNDPQNCSHKGSKRKKKRKDIEKILFKVDYAARHNHNSTVLSLDSDIVRHMNTKMIREKKPYCSFCFF